MPFVMRVPGYSYGGEEGPGEHVHDCYLDRLGQCTTARAQAQVYPSAAAAWDHFWAAGFSLEEYDCPVKSRVEEIP